MDILDISEEDVDMLSEGIDSHFKENYTLKDCKSVGLDDTYILNLDVNTNNQTTAGLSNQNVLIFDENLNKIQQKKLLNKVINVKFSPKHSELFYTGTSDCVQLWDKRTKDEEGVFQIDTNNGQHAPKPFTTFDMNITDQFLVAGTEVVNHDSFLLFWDIRGKNMLGGYWETFGEDLTVTKFAPNDPNQLIAASSDGQVN